MRGGDTIKEKTEREGKRECVVVVSASCHSGAQVRVADAAVSLGSLHQPNSCLPRGGSAPVAGPAPSRNA